MSLIRLDAGIYTNVFPIELPDDLTSIMTTARERFPDLRLLREKIEADGKNSRVYAAGRTVYGYGRDMLELASDGFQKGDIVISENPILATRLVSEGIADALRGKGYDTRFGKGRLTSIQSEPARSVTNSAIQVFLGYDLRAIHWRDETTGGRAFGLVIDITWAIRDRAGNRLNTHQVAQFGATFQVAQAQGEFLPGGSRINTEVARQRLQEHILPFVQENEKFALPCGGDATLLPEPVRVILGGRE